MNALLYQLLAAALAEAEQLFAQRLPAMTADQRAEGEAALSDLRAQLAKLAQALNTPEA